MKKEKQQVSVFWFRRDLRLKDNHGLYMALKNSKSVLPVFIFDTQILDDLISKKDKRVTFIYHTLKGLNEKLKEYDSSFYILNDTPIKSFGKVCEDFDVKEVYTNHDYEPYAIERDLGIKKYLNRKGIPFHTYKDQVLFEKDEVLKSDGTPYTVFTPYSKIWKQKYFEGVHVSYSSERLLSHLFKTKLLRFPTLEEIGFEEVDMKVPKLNISEKVIGNYDETRNLPILPTSHASVHLRFGTVSVRYLVKEAVKLNEQWLNELIWREFFMMILYHFPHVVNQSFKKKYDKINWRNNEKDFNLWCKGETGYPIVDAGMRQLNETGWMHNRVRMIVASFLTKDLLINWRWGEAYFAEKLLDYELSSNNGNWQWAAGSGCDAAPYFRIFNPETQTKNFDPEHKYIKKWIKDYKPGYLPPIVDHDFARKRALETYKKALK